MKIDYGRCHQRIRTGYLGFSLILLVLFGFSTVASSQSVCTDMVFSDQTLNAGIIHTYNHPLIDGAAMAGGAVAEDFNNDGWLDLYVVQGSGGSNLLYINDKLGGFSNEAAAWSADLAVAGVAASAADYDNDGDVDVAVSILATNSIVQVNNGAGEFASNVVLPNPPDHYHGFQLGRRRQRRTARTRHR